MWTVDTEIFKSGIRVSNSRVFSSDIINTRHYSNLEILCYTLFADLNELISEYENHVL